MSSRQPPAGGPAGRLPGDSLGDPMVPPGEINSRSSDRGDSLNEAERNVDAEAGSQNKAQQIRAQAVERAQQIRVRTAAKAPQVAQANKGKAVAAFAFVLLVLWLRRRRNRRSSRTADGVAGALDQQARSLVEDKLDALSAEAESTSRAQKTAQKAHGRAAAKAHVRVQAIEKAQQARAQAIAKAQQLREQATEKAHAAEKAQQAAQEAQQLVQALRQWLPKRVKA
jgi:colicin import membrane protein